MTTVTFRVLEGIDKGRFFRDLPMPVTIGREEGNVIRLNDERVSRFHTKIQFDNDEIILTDLDSTNGTRVNEAVVGIRRLRHGDRVSIGRSVLLFGSDEEIAARMTLLSGAKRPPITPTPSATRTPQPATIPAHTLATQFDHDVDFDLEVPSEVTVKQGTVFMGERPLPPLPQKLTPSQAARLAELIDFLHRQLTLATETIGANEEGTQVTLDFADWQRVLALQMVLARYVRAIGEPDQLEQ